MSYSDFIERHLAAYREELRRFPGRQRGTPADREWTEHLVEGRRKFLEYNPPTPDDEEAFLDLVRPRLREMLAAHRAVAAVKVDEPIPDLRDATPMMPLAQLFAAIGTAMFLDPAVWQGFEAMARRAVEPVVKGRHPGVNPHKDEVDENGYRRCRDQDMRPEADADLEELRSLFAKITTRPGGRPVTRTRDSWVRKYLSTDEGEARLAVARDAAKALGVNVATLRSYTAPSRRGGPTRGPGRPRKKRI